VIQKQVQVSKIHICPPNRMLKKSIVALSAMPLGTCDSLVAHIFSGLQP
jgi:hypothetical protein